LLPCCERKLESSGIQTKRDKVAIAPTKTLLLATIDDFATMSTEAIRAKYDLPADGRDWAIVRASEHARDILVKVEELSPCLYRPFDVRWTIIDDRPNGIVAYPRYKVMRHMKHDNIGLITTRQLSLSTFQHVWATKHAIDGNTISLQTREYNYLFPLYLYPDTGNARGVQHSLLDTLESSEPTGRRHNLKDAAIDTMKQHMGLSFIPDGVGNLTTTFGPEDIFHYVYAILHSPTYRTRYFELLKTDFPRVPLTHDLSLFRLLTVKGSQLVALHCPNTATSIPTTGSYPVSGSNIVEAGFPRYLSPREAEPRTGVPLTVGRVYINNGNPATGSNGQYFDGVSPEVWGFEVGGYRVCEKWLKDRRKEMLSLDDLMQYQRIVTVLAKTILLMDEIDDIIPAWPLT